MLWKFSHYNYSCNSIGFGKYVLHITAKCETSIVFIWSIRRFLHLLNITSWAEYGYFSSVDFEISDLGPTRLYFEAGLGSISNMPSDDKMPPSLGVTRFRVVQLLQNLTEAPANFDSDDNTMRHRYDTTNFLKQKKYSQQTPHSSPVTLQWRHNGRDDVSNHQRHDCLLKRLFRRRSKKTSKLRVTGLCAGNSPGTGEFPAQRASNAENIPIWWRHYVGGIFLWVDSKIFTGYL